MTRATSSDGAEDGLRRTLVDAGRDFDRRGWVMGTSGNLSARLPDGGVLITASGCHKGHLTTADFLVAGRAGEARRPSAELSIHEALYAGVPGTQAVVHAHSVAMTAASLLAPGSEGAEWLQVPNLEMIKGFDRPASDDGIRLLVLPNWRDVPRIAGDLAARLAELEAPAFLIRGHGGTAWGRSVEEARNRLEVLDFLCEVVLRRVT